MRSLTLYGVTPWLLSSVEMWLSSLSELESFAALHGADDNQFSSIEFPTMPRLKTVKLQSKKLRMIVNLDSAHTPLLSSLFIQCQTIETSSFPDSLKQLTLHSQECSVHVLASIAKLSKLEALEGYRAVDILSQPNLHFASTLTKLKYSSELTDSARAKFPGMDKLASLEARGS